MAKKPRKDENADGEGRNDDEGQGQGEGEGQGQGQGQGQAVAPVGASKKKLVVIAGVAAIVLALAGGGGWWFFLSGGEAADGVDVAETEPQRPAAFIEVPQMTVNLSPEPNEERPRFLRFTVRLELAQAQAAPEIEPLMPRIQDAFQTYVRELRPSDLHGSAGVYRLREELLRRVNIAVHPAKVDAVLFGEVVVQ